MDVSKTILKILNEHNDYYGNEVNIDNPMIKAWIDLFKEEKPNAEILKAYVLVIEGGFEPSDVLLVTSEGCFKVIIPNDNDGSVGSFFGIERKPDIKYLANDIESAARKEGLDYLN